MSHFAIMVITDQKPDGDMLEKIMAPYHEFECTGDDNEYVQNIDRMAEHLEEFNDETELRYKDPSGTLHDPFQDQFYRDPTPEETEKMGIGGGTGCGHGMSWTSKDWGDGKGYRTKVHILPDGWEEVRVKASAVTSFADWITDYHGMTQIGANDVADPKTNDNIKYGWVRVNDAGEVLEVIDRTNPNKKWDWWQMGGRWSGFLTPKVGTNPANTAKGSPGTLGSQADPDGVDTIRKGDVDFETMRANARKAAEESWDKIMGIVGDLSDLVPWDKVRDEMYKDDIEKAREFYNSQRAQKALLEARQKNDGLFWVNLDEYIVDRQTYGDRAASSATVLFGVVKDGKWVERGEMGWWGCVSNEQDRSAWDASFNKMLDELPDDSWLTVVDCHI